MTATAIPSARRRGVLAVPAAAQLPVALVVLAMPFVRPNLFGERLSVVGVGLLALAALLSLVTRPAGQAASRGSAPTTPIVVCLGLAYLWLMIQAAATDPLLGRPAVQGMVLTAGGVLAVVIVCQEPAARRALGRAFVLVIAAFCASYVVTALIWAAAGVGSGLLVSLPIGTAGIEPVYLPLTPTVGDQSVLGTVFPRFTGLGREPGWMAMYCAAAYFLTDMVGLHRRRLKLLIVVGLVGCISTAGFGVFVVAWAYHTFLRDRGTGISIAGFLRQLSGVVATLLAAWLAVDAPVLGLAAKSTQNATSLDERQLATEAGLRALFTSPLGGTPTEVQGGINLISDIAVSGLPFVLLVCAALLLPVLSRRGTPGFGNVIIVIVFLTMLFSQPAKDSTWAFALVAMVVSLRAPLAAEPTTIGAPVNFRDYLALLRERRLLIGACVAVGLVVAAVVTLLMPTKYASTVTFYVVAGSAPSPANAASDNYQGAQLATERVKSYTELLTGERVAQDAAAALGGGTTPEDVMRAVSATSVADTVIVTLSATDTSPARAEQLATAVSTSFTALVRRLETAGVQTPDGAPAQPAVSAQVLQPPSLPGAPVSPSLPLNLAIGLIVGLLAGFGAAVVRHSLDVTVRSAEELADVAGAPVLGSVPEERDPRRAPTSAAPDRSGYARTEAFHRIRTTLQSRRAGVTDGIGRVLVVTSAVPGEGRTTIACNLAGALAAVGSRVVLVDGDLRRPAVAAYLGLGSSPGLTAVLAGRASFSEAVLPSSDDGLVVLTSGAPTPRPNELVASRPMSDLIGWMRAQYDYVIIDTPPVLAVADAANLAAHSDGVVLVSRWGVTQRPELESAVSFLKSVSVPVVGTVLFRTPDHRATGTARYGDDVPDGTAPTPEGPRAPDHEAIGGGPEKRTLTRQPQELG